MSAPVAMTLDQLALGALVDPTIAAIEHLQRAQQRQQALATRFGGPAYWVSAPSVEGTTYTLGDVGEMYLPIPPKVSHIHIRALMQGTGTITWTVPGVDATGTVLRITNPAFLPDPVESEWDKTLMVDDAALAADRRAIEVRDPPDWTWSAVLVDYTHLAATTIRLWGFLVEPVHVST